MADATRYLSVPMGSSKRLPGGEAGPSLGRGWVGMANSAPMEPLASFCFNGVSKRRVRDADAVWPGSSGTSKVKPDIRGMRYIMECDGWKATGQGLLAHYGRPPPLPAEPTPGGVWPTDSMLPRGCWDVVEKRRREEAAVGALVELLPKPLLRIRPHESLTTICTSRITLNKIKQPLPTPPPRKHSVISINYSNRGGTSILAGRNEAFSFHLKQSLMESGTSSAGRQSPDQGLSETTSEPRAPAMRHSLVTRSRFRYFDLTASCWGGGGAAKPHVPRSNSRAT